ncbi:MAG: hypothetical protein P8P74_12760 [Crocinitomicaceae bacterium]|nr:hypothetical protein [Crocinitomicaceae bacterium]
MRVYFFIISAFFAISCGTQREVEVEVVTSGSGCSGSYEKYEHSELPSVKTVREYIPITDVVIAYGVIGPDTLEIAELECVDSLLFTEALNDVEVSQMCIELAIEGNTYFSAKTNKFGGFETIEVVRGVDKCFRNAEDKIKQKVLSMRTVSTDYGNMELIFYLKVRLE